MAAKIPQIESGRRAMLAKVHLAAKELGLDEDARRDVLERLTGHRSAGDCSDAQLDQVLAEFKRLGWKPKPAIGARPRLTSHEGGLSQAEKPGLAASSKGVQRASDSPFAKKARAMWISLHQLGVVRDPSERALQAFGRRQLKVDALSWADEGQSFRLIEALKGMAERAGWSQDLAMVKPARQVWSLKARLLNAQLERLQRPAPLVAGWSEADLDREIRKAAAEIHALDEAGHG